jgi:hypothetical protein
MIARLHDEVLRTLPAGESLPGLPSTGWEETVLLAAEMAADPDAFVGGLLDNNAALAGRCAALSSMRQRLSLDVLDRVRQRLAAVGSAAMAEG